jgi:two-component system response regulator MprA
MDVAEHVVRRAGRKVDLTAQEFDLLHYFLLHPRQVLTRSQLLDAVWGFDAETTSNVVDVYVGYVRAKLEESGEPRLIQTVRGVGYILRES